MTERKGLRLTIPDDAPSGTVQAVFSTFDVLDKQRDIVKRKAFADLDGADVPLIWSHDWGGMAVGKGHIVVQPKQAVFDGAFHLQTQWSRDAYETVKAMAGLQEYSYGFDIASDGFEWTEADDGDPARIVTKIARVYEVSPVLVGAGEDTRTLAIKGLAADLDALKAGRTISAATRARIQTALEALQALLAAPDDDASDEGKGADPPDDGASGEPVDAKPLPNFHACRLRDPGDFQDGSFRQMTRDHEGKEYRVIVGRLKGETSMTQQAFRYGKATWDAAAARSHCGSHDGTFEAAGASEAAAPLPRAPGDLPAHGALEALHAAVAWARTASDRDVRTHDAALRSLADALRDGREILTRRVAQAEATASVDLEAIRAQLAANAAYYGLRGTGGGS